MNEPTTSNRLLSGSSICRLAIVPATEHVLAHAVDLKEGVLHDLVLGDRSARGESGSGVPGLFLKLANNGRRQLRYSRQALANVCHYRFRLLLALSGVTQLAPGSVLCMSIETYRFYRHMNQYARQHSCRKCLGRPMLAASCLTRSFRNLLPPMRPLSGAGGSLSSP